MLGDDLARVMAAVRAGLERDVECQVCGTRFRTKGRGRYCSKKCKQRAFRASHAPTPPTAPPASEEA